MKKTEDNQNEYQNEDLHTTVICNAPGALLKMDSTHPPLYYPIPDPIDHPSHYQGKSMEAIDVIEAFDLGFCLGNAIKYILRAGKKGNRREDLQKAIWYLQREINSE